MRTELAAARSALWTRRILAIVAIALAYALVSVVGALAAYGPTPGLTTALRRAFVAPWAFHLTLLPFLTGVVALPWRKWLSRGERRG